MCKVTNMKYSFKGLVATNLMMKTDLNQTGGFSYKTDFESDGHDRPW